MFWKYFFHRLPLWIAIGFEKWKAIIAWNKKAGRDGESNSSNA
jgi:hypothetical protein